MNVEDLIDLKVNDFKAHRVCKCTHDKDYHQTFLDEYFFDDFCQVNKCKCRGFKHINQLQFIEYIAVLRNENNVANPS